MTFSETFLVFLVPLDVLLGVKFGFRKSCLCKRNDKYEVCARAKKKIDMKMVQTVNIFPLDF